MKEEKDTITTDEPKSGAFETLGRTFETGAYRDTEEGKFDYEGFLSPLVIQEFGRYMNKHRLQSNGVMRDSDNWQKGISKEVYMKSLWRHMHDLWMEQRGYESRDGIDEALGGLLFNCMGYWYEILKEKEGKYYGTSASSSVGPRQDPQFNYRMGR